DPLLQAGQRLDVAARQQVRAGAQELAELDEAGAQLLQRRRQVRGVVVAVLVLQPVVLILVTVAGAELGGPLVQLVLAADAQDLQVALGVAREATGDQRGGQRRAVDVLLEPAHAWLLPAPGSGDIGSTHGAGRRIRRRAREARRRLAGSDLPGTNLLAS